MLFAYRVLFARGTLVRWEDLDSEAVCVTIVLFGTHSVSDVEASADKVDRGCSRYLSKKTRFRTAGTAV